MQAQPALQDIFFVSHEAIPARFMPSVMTTNPPVFMGIAEIHNLSEIVAGRPAALAVMERRSEP
jgi:hypothetical protein